MIRNTLSQYGKIAILFHWGMAILILGLFVLGLYMARIPVSLLKLKLFGWHKELGILVLLLLPLRLFWRLINITPLLPASLPAWQKLAAHSMHWMLYAGMFVIPMTGWILSSAAGISVSFFGWFVLPNFVTADAWLQQWSTFAHQWLSYALILAVCGHASAALWHHFIHKDDVLRRML